MYAVTDRGMLNKKRKREETPKLTGNVGGFVGVLPNACVALELKAPPDPTVSPPHFTV